MSCARRRCRFAPALGIVALITTAACGQDTNSAGSTPVEIPRPAEGEIVHDPSPDPSVAGDDGTATTHEGDVTEPVEPAPPPTAPPEPHIANRTVRNDEASGLRLTFVVADKLVFARDEPIWMELVIENTSGRPVFHDSNQRHVFSIVSTTDPDLAWSDMSCRSAGTTGPPRTGVHELAPGESASFIGAYPVDHVPGSPADADGCRLPPGEYQAFGQVDWCPDHTLQRPGGGPPHCDPHRVVAVASVPLTIEVV
jgi:hypothetical protein